jgi:hypothetical protein
MWKAFGPTTARMQSDPDFGLVEARILARGEAHVAGEYELATAAPHATSDLCDGDHGDLVRRTNVSIRIERPEGPMAVVMFPVLPVKSKWARFFAITGIAGALRGGAQADLPGEARIAVRHAESGSLMMRVDVFQAVISHSSTIMSWLALPITAKM